MSCKLVKTADMQICVLQGDFKIATSVQGEFLAFRGISKPDGTLHIKRDWSVCLVCKCTLVVVLGSKIPKLY